MVIKNVSIRDVMDFYPSWDSKLYVFMRNLILPVSKINEYVPSEGVIIDVGCGFGSNTIYLALKSPERKLVGYELNTKRVNEAKMASKSLDNVSFEVKDLTKDSELQHCDAICLFDVLHHLPVDAQVNVLKESYKKLKTGGVLVLKDIDRKPFWKYFFNLLHDKIMTKNSRLYFSDKESTKEKIEPIGFKVLKGPEYLKVHFLNPYPHYILIAKK